MDHCFSASRALLRTPDGVDGAGAGGKTATGIAVRATSFPDVVPDPDAIFFRVARDVSARRCRVRPIQERKTEKTRAGDKRTS